MRRATSILLLFWFSANLFSQNPHGAALKMDCAACHSPAGWEIASEHWKGIELQKPQKSKTTGLPLPVDSSLFHHNKTAFPLKGRHAVTDCRDCHETLVFENTSSDCISCHTDIHQMTVGNDCARCHTSSHWLVDNITELHQENGFPLTGVHTALSCNDCHTSETALRFDRIGNDCVSCHLDEFNASTNPNHKEAGFSTNCLDCHDPFTADWNTDKVDHSFFPLTKGHEISDCAACHAGGDFANTPNNCFACHQPDFENTLQPNHVTAGFTNDCAQCHTTDPDWTPAQFTAHDGQYFPIYSGKHQGVWNQCTECHTDPNNYASNSCVVCHLNPETDDGHVGVAGYVYENSACLACHPTGDVDGSFDHNASNFPLAGAHITTDCIECHANGYAGTPTECAACHTQDFNETTNPNHGNLGLSNDCASCHGLPIAIGTGWAPATFDVHNDFYVLNGAHAVISNDCAACHNGDYNNTPNTCMGCHTADFNAATDPNHAANQFPNDCTTCHSESSWAPSTFDHAAIYPFTGAHVPIANDCALCHVNGNYTSTPNECAGCHTPDFNQSQNPNHVALALPNDCAMCHTTEPDWEPAQFPIHDDFYVLNGAHAVIANDCAACHNGDYNNTPNTCFGCHSADYNATLTPNHVALNFSQDCTGCHTETTWSPATFDHDAQYFPIYSGAHNGEWDACTDCHTNPNNYAEFTCITCHADPQTSNDHAGVGGYVYESNACLACHPTGDATNIFDHNTTAFPLTGAHLGAVCLDCHAGGFQNTPTDCAACHTTDFNQSQNPNHVALNIPMDCASCHGLPIAIGTGWAPASFAIHDDFYVLNGAHAVIANDCAACHNGDYNNTPNTCMGCHTADFNAATDPNHSANQFPNDCTTCHSESSWAPSTFDHAAIYPFTGAHVPIANDCALCHVNGNYTSTPNECAGCHTPDFNQSQNPNHVALALPNDCAMCHTTQPDWQPAAFPLHDDFYVLNGAHAVIANDCALCHPGGNYNNTPNTCFGCHSAEYNATTNPNHQAAQFPTDCLDCHGETAWVPSTFDHDAQYFPIYSGGHEGEWSECIDCHSNPANYAEVVCTTCHANPQTNDQHVGVGGYSYNSPACLACHPTGDATNIFDHNTTAFPLTGAHLQTDCLQCHSAGYQGTPTDCAACHLTDFNQSQNPNHVALNLPMDCASCHTTEPGWEPATFAIHDDFYVLNGAHAAIANDCATCHNGDYNNTPNTCNGCHSAEYTAAADPNHAANQLPTTCQDCHGETAWVPSTFDHAAIYPFTGAHVPVANDCALCHVGGNYSTTPNTCAGCHTPNFNQSQNPNHVALGLPNDCAMCHTTDPDWEPASFPIHDDFYVLNGAHAVIANDCAACHNGDYNNTPNTCYGCHTAEYNATTNPNHAAAQFSTDCTTCHSETAWVPATFDHDGQYFPIYSGTHEGEWSECVDCHTNPNNFAQFTCTTCHANPETNNQHAGVGGYVYESSACLACHPTGEGTGFDHNNTAFPLTGAHLNVDCIDCHSAGYQGTPANCDACHLTNFNNSTNPNHVALGIPTDCATCHTTAPGWAPATFPIHDNYWALTGAHIPVANDCAACHNGDYNNTPNTCAGCHTPDYNASTNPNHVALGIPTDCDMCHTTEPDWEPATFPIHDDFYVLNGAHAVIANDCAACHNGNYNNTPNTCAGCHLDDYNGTTNPNHAAAQFPTTCNDCHTETAWTPANFDHNAFYPLNGAHAAIANDCAACHIGGNYSNTPNTCNGCHNDDYAATTDPNHAANQFPTTCDDCHTETAWVPSTFDHSAFFPFTGAHIPIANDCALCHIGGNYNNTPNTCAGCHTPDYNASTNPNHVALGIPTDCEMCHTTAPDWEPATFPIHNNYYQLNGAHATIANDCAACHNGNYNNTPNTCAGCHIDDYNGTTNPNHAAAQFPTTCDDCHTETAWVPSTFDHNAFYPLTGAHIPIANDCALCHIGGNYNNTPNTCAGCHTPDYNASTNPSHTALGLPMDCEQCHTTAPDWEPATFPIHNNYYQLNGAHATIANDCAACHNGNYNNTPNTCSGCHLDDYNATTNPNHASNQFPTTCEDCHTETAWVPSTFDHSAFYPLTGAHIPIANDCALCHVGGNYNNTPNTCEGCHMPDYNSSVNPNHVALAIPTDCAMCHTTDPDWEPATFPIHNQYWQFQGAHLAIQNDCAACHNGNYNNTPNTCYGCHQSEYNSATNPNHAAAGFPTDCTPCHNQNAWEPATWDHDNMYFPIYSGKHEGEWTQCIECHTTPNNFTLYSCIDCHEHDDPVEMAQEHQGVSGYQYVSTACYACHPEGED